MKPKYIRLITFTALSSILLLQGMWLYNTYKLLEAEFKKNISNLFILSVEKEAILRLEDPMRKEMREGKILKGLRPENDHYTNNKVLQDWLYKEDGPIFSISLENVDSIFKEEAKGHYEYLDYSFLLTDSLGSPIAFINHEPYINERFAYQETVQLRNTAPEYITLVILSPYKIIFGKMLLMLIGSFALAVLVACGLILQVRIINRQKKIAALRQDFTYAMVHDMKNPIASILMGIGSLRSGKIDDKPDRKEYHYRIITQESEHILKLADKILEIARFENQHATLIKQQINLSDLLESLTEKYISHAAKKVRFRMELNEVKHIYADPHYIYEAFNNLIDNAVKYSKENKDAEITITGSQNKNNTRIIFRDNGIGISDKDQKKIFQKFKRVQSEIENRNKANGFGLGLNFVYQVIKSHGGTIRVKSRLGSYSEFIINLPGNEKNKTVIN